jgi:predicted DNA-binding transcriptional regulator AlpA
MADLKLLDVREVAEMLGIAVRTVWRLSATGELPPPVRLAARVRRWRLADIEQHIDALVERGRR